ncbi:MAG: glycosyltransferase [Minisyncoccia bacterium]
MNINYHNERTSLLRRAFLDAESPKALLVVNAGAAILYFFVLCFVFPIGNSVLFGLLVFGEVFHLWQVLTFLYTVWDTSYAPPQDDSYQPGVDVFITVCGEEREIVEKTARAALDMDYPDFAVHILNDGYVAHKENWHEMEELAHGLGINCITRQIPGGAKAGNINHAATVTRKPIIVIFDADYMPHRDFLRKTTPYFVDPLVGFVQTPQYYKNWAANYVTRSSWEQQELFYGAICKGKNRLNAAIMCGTNMLISRAALQSVGGMNTVSIAEDSVTGLFMHARGWRSVYVPEVLAEGLATEDLLSYSNQQFRWARGNLDILFRYNPFFMRGLTFAQRIQYLSSASFFLSGPIVVIDALLPIVFFFSGLVPVHVSGMLLALVFLPYFFLTLYVIERSSNWSFTFESLGFSMGVFAIHVRALVATLLRRKSAFSVTPKAAQTGNFIMLAKWHIAYLLLALVGMSIALAREGVSASFINNTAWVAVNSAAFLPFIRASLPQRRAQRAAEPAAQLELAQ